MMSTNYIEVLQAQKIPQINSKYGKELIIAELRVVHIIFCMEGKDKILESSKCYGEN